MSNDHPQKNRYEAIVEEVFFSKYKPGDPEVKFARDDFAKAASKLGIVLPKNLGDIIYSIRLCKTT